ncbi:MAG: cell division protein FtsZ [Rhodobacteraceae bacterium]|nr:cell division protein FtsZ [Paracoccaceae bacterium]
MALNLTLPEQHDLKPRITVFGVGGAGGNAVNNMIAQELDGVEFVVANTDAQALAQSRAQSRIQMGVKATEGLGAGARPVVGAKAAEESIEQIVDHLVGAHMCFITAGMGGGTGTGAAPIIAQAARELGVLTVGVVTKPFQFEGAKRMRQAEDGVEALQKVVDTLIIIPNQNLFRLASEKTTFTEAFAMADDVLYQGVKGVTDLMVKPGLINLDFADVRSVMDEMGKAMMGTGEASGEDRAVQAAEKAIANPLLDEISLKGAKGVLINITGGFDLTLFELDEAANRIKSEVDPEANIIIGSTLDPTMEGAMRVSVVATGIDALDVSQEIPVPRRKLSQPLKSAQLVEESVTRAPAEPVEEPAFDELPSLLDEAHDMSEEEGGSLFAEDEADDDVFDEDDLPPPAYRPEAERPAARASQASDELAGFVAPKAPAPGTASPDAMARLRTAVSKAPQGGVRTMQPTAPQPQQRPAEARSETERAGRFGINSLISRMTGHAAAGETPAPRREPPRAVPPSALREEPEDEMRDPEQERIEIPAFLRRQAN